MIHISSRALLKICVGSLLSLFIGPKFCEGAVADSVLRARAAVIEKSHMGLSSQQAMNICRFIERQRRISPTWSQKIFRSSQTRLPCTVERNKQLRSYIVRVNESGHIGSGCHKSVNRAVMYGARTRVIAECDCDKTAKGEIQALERLRGSRGIVPFLGSSERARNKRYSIFLEYFSCGSLSHMLRAKKQFTIPQAIKIAQDLAMGLRNMHAKKMVHRDLHWGNVLLRPTKNGLYDAVLVDFGKTANYKEIRDEIPQGAKSRHPPEALLVPFKKLERFSIDIYALGCTLYQVVWGKLHPWALTYNAYDVDKYGKRECIRKYQGIVSSYRSTKSTCLASANKKLANGQKLSPGDKFKILIFDMMHFNPKNRPNLQTIISRLEKISASEVQ